MVVADWQTVFLRKNCDNVFLVSSADMPSVSFALMIIAAYVVFSKHSKKVVVCLGYRKRAMTEGSITSSRAHRERFFVG